MSHRDLWLHEDLIEAEDPRFDYFVYDGTIYDKPHPGLIHYRKVNPALDAVIEGLVIAIEKMLEMYPKEIFDGNSGDEGPQRIVDAYNALANYKKAKGDK